jgi:hypothetical protein
MQQDVVLRFSTDREDFKGTLSTFMAPTDQVAFERTYSVGLGELENAKRVEWVLWLVWRAWTREHPSGVAFEDFLAELSEYELPQEDEDRPPVTEKPTG